MVFSNPRGTLSPFYSVLCTRLGVTDCGKLLIFLLEEKRAPALPLALQRDRRKSQGWGGWLEGVACLLTRRSSSGVSESVQGLGFSSHPPCFQLRAASG